MRNQRPAAGQVTAPPTRQSKRKSAQKPPLTSSPALLGASWLMGEPSRPARFRPRESTRIVETRYLPRSARGLERDGGSVFPAHANTADPNGSVEAYPVMRTHAR